MIPTLAGQTGCQSRQKPDRAFQLMDANVERALGEVTRVLDTVGLAGSPTDRVVSYRGCFGI